MQRPRVLRRQLIYQGRIIRLLREVLEIHGQRLVRETISHPGAVVVIPLLGRDRLVLIRQYRRSVDRVLLELPAGTLAAGERKAACATRELEEETGWRATRMTRVAQFYAAPGFLSEQMTLFLAEGLKPVAAHPEPDELLEPVVMSVSQALRAIRTGKICDAKTIIGILLLRDRLRSVGVVS